MIHHRGPKLPLSDMAVFMKVYIGSVGGHLIKLVSGVELGIRILKSGSDRFFMD